MDEKLERLLRNTSRKQNPKRKLGNQKKVWTKQSVGNSTIYIDE